MREEIVPAAKRIKIEEGPTNKTKITLKFTNKKRNKAKILQGTTVIGSISADLIARNKNFHIKCDDISRDTQALGFCMFQSDGSPRCVELISAKKPKKKGNFLYINKISFEDDFLSMKSNSDAGTEAVAQFLDAYADKWNVAAYIGDCEAELTTSQQDLISVEEMFLLLSPSVSDEVRFQRAEQRRRRFAADVRQFVRNGFQELSKETQSEPRHMYISSDMWAAWKARPTKMTHEDSLSVKLRVDVPLAMASFITVSKDQELWAYLVSTKEILMGTPPSLFSRAGSIDTVATVMEEIKKLEATGADINRANALEVCAENGITVLLDPLVRHGALVNGCEQDEYTPLMAAAGTSDADASTIRALLALGADKNMTDGAGRTALGLFYQAHRDTRDFRACSGLPGAHKPPDSTIVSLLRPSNGLTEADKRCVK